MKKIKLFLLVLMVMFSGIITVNANAETPEYEVIGGKKVLLANGTEITIKAPKTAGMGALVTWNGGEIEIAADTSIFGGKHNSTDKVSTKITMEGGTVRNIFGGGLHISYVSTAEIVVNGGKITSAIMGGGYEEFTECTEGDYNKVTEADVLNSTTKVDKTLIVVNGGNLDGAQVYGGGGAHSYTGNAEIYLHSFEGTVSYLTAGGSNGYTEKAHVELNDGKVGVLQGVNRGSMDQIYVAIQGGEVKNAYVGGENDPSVTGTFTASVMEITDGKVENLYPGTNGVDKTTNAAISAKDSIEVLYNEDSVTNIDKSQFSEDSVIPMIDFIMVLENAEETISVPAGMSFTSEEVEKLKKAINEELEESMKEVEDFYSDEEYTKKFDFTAPINNDVKVYIKIVELRENDGTVNPDTSDISIYAVVLSILLGTAGLGYTIKKRRFS